MANTTNQQNQGGNKPQDGNKPQGTQQDGNKPQGMQGGKPGEDAARSGQEQDAQAASRKGAADEKSGATSGQNNR